MTAKRFVINNKMKLDNKIETYNLSCIVDNENKTFYFIVDDLANVESFVERLNLLCEENEQLKQQRIDLLRLIDNNIEIYENINTNVEFHKGEIQGKLTLLYNLRELILK